jgi:Flp pilus assembly protein TadD
MSGGRAVVAAWVAGASVWALSAAAAQPSVTPEQVMSGTLLGATGRSAPEIGSSEVLALSDDMRRFLRDHVNRGAPEGFKMQQLIDAMMGSADFELEYDETTRTAAETFRLRRGNCLSFTLLFVALARGAGLDARFQEVDIPPDWSTGEGVFVLNRHINVFVDLGMSGSRAVDFNIGDFKTNYEIDQISDRRAIAHFFNNMGVERMQAGDVVGSVVYFRQAIVSSDRGFSPAWTNLGLLYRRAGLLEHAEVAYLEAMKVESRNYVAMSNLATLYEQRGEIDIAEQYRRKVRRHRLQNPHLRYRLAELAFEDRDFDTAIHHLKFATRKDKDAPEYCLLMAKCLLETGNEKKARSWLAKAERLAEDERQARRYSAEFEALVDELSRGSAGRRAPVLGPVSP